ncbi:MAG TPA: DNA polymerase III subunit gamma/tau [Patescibacteria group bacterium]|nr:DNA polymerase III subunit gamma/tau [Patescibacteria group bacterium]
MGQALYRTHRPTKLSEVVGQEHITTALERALKKGTVSHAYLFTGPRGVGKTSIARILAHEINGLPYEDDSIHLDIIEIDAASNRRIDEIRDLRNKVHIAPTSAKYKVYIIDEVHMLTKEAFNALLKTLEEPPAHVVFILATTEVHKLPETIISRTQRFAFKAVDLPKVVEHLRSIAKAEKIDISDEALELIAAHGEGSFRDSISLLDQIRNTADKITLEDVQATLGIAPQEQIDQLLAALGTHDPVAVTTLLAHIQSSGHDPAKVAKQLGQALRTQLLANAAELSNEQAMSVLTKLIELPASHDPRSYLEIILLDVALSGETSDRGGSRGGTPSARNAVSTMGEVSADRTPPASDAHEKAKPTPSKIMKEEVQEKSQVQIEPHPSTFAKAVKEAGTEPVDKSIWPTFLAAVKAKHNTLYSIVRTARPHFDQPGKLTLECSTAFYQKRLNDKRNKEMLGATLESVCGQNLQIICIVGESLTPDELPGPSLPPEQAIVHKVEAEPVSAKPQSEAVKAISNIFGGAELLES